MKKYIMKIKLYSIISLIFMIVLIGCSKEETFNYNKLLIEKSVGDFDEYEKYKEITDKDTIKNVNDSIKNIKWENAKICMTSPPNYKLYFEYNNSNSKDSKKVYELWISPNKEQIELVLDTETKYAQLNKQDSKRLLDIILNLK